MDTTAIYALIMACLAALVAVVMVVPWLEEGAPVAVQVVEEQN
ncbi:MAG: hypothetical protein U0350_14650 [Caldilineaceae bacterium]